MRPLIFLLLSCFCVSCAAQGDLADVHQGPPFVFDITALPLDYQADAIAAVGAWNQAERPGFADVGADGPNRIELGELNGPYALAFTACDASGCTTTLDPDAVTPGCPGVLIHEMGHVFASHWDNPPDPVHSPNPADVMYKFFGCDKRPTVADVASIPF